MLGTLCQVNGGGGEGTGHHLWLVTRLKSKNYSAFLKRGGDAVEPRADRLNTKEKDVPRWKLELSQRRKGQGAYAFRAQVV